MSLGNAKILIIEGNQELAQLWAGYLSKRGFDVQEFIDGTTELSQVHAWGQPDVIVSGVEFNGNFMSGVEFCAQLYEDADKDRYIPVIQLTSESSAADSSACTLLRKPVKLAELLAALRKAYGQALKAKLQKTKNPVMTAELAGNALVGVLHFIGNSEKTGVALVESPIGNATINFRDGRPENAMCGDLAGEDAVSEVMSWAEGQVTFFAGDPGKLQANIVDRSVDDVIGEAKRQAAAIQEAEAAFASPDVQLQRGDAALEEGSDPVKTSIHEALKKRMTLKELRAALPALTYRQLMVKLNEAKQEGLVAGGGKPFGINGLSDEFREEMVRGIEENDITFQVTRPKKVGVFAAAPSLAARFIGRLCDEELASSAVMRFMNLMLLINDTQQPQQASSLFDTSVVLALFDPEDKGSIAATASFIALARDSAADTCAIAYLKPKDEDPEKFLKLLYPENDKILSIPFELDKASCLDVIKAALRAN